MVRKPSGPYLTKPEPLFPELTAELDAIKETLALGLIFRPDHEDRRSRTQLPWITERKDLRYLRGVVKG